MESVLNDRWRSADEIAGPHLDIKKEEVSEWVKSGEARDNEQGQTPDGRKG